MTVYNPNDTWFSANLFIQSSQYVDTGWHWIGPRTQHIFSLNRSESQVKKMGLRVSAEIGTEKRQIPPGKVFMVHIVPHTALPKYLELAEAEMLTGGCTAENFRQHFRYNPAEHRHRFFVVKGLYAWRVSLGQPNAQDWRKTAREAFDAAYTVNQREPFDIYPDAWTAGTKTEWILMAKDKEKDNE